MILLLEEVDFDDFDWVPILVVVTPKYVFHVLFDWDPIEVRTPHGPWSDLFDGAQAAALLKDRVFVRQYAQRVVERIIHMFQPSEIRGRNAQTYVRTVL